MTLYYQIVEFSNVDVKFYVVRRAWKFLGFMVSPSGVSRWVGQSYKNSTNLYMHEIFRGVFDTLEEAREAAECHAASSVAERRRENAKSKVVETIVVKE